MAKESLNTLKLDLANAIKERDANLQTAQNAIAIANEFGAKLESIETRLQLPFLQKGLFKKLWWVITHLNEIATLIEDIIAQIREWRDYVNKLKSPKQPII